MPSGMNVPFEEFVRTRLTHLFRLALLLAGGNHADAEDLLQTALERASRRWAWLARDGNPEPYVRRVLVNAAIDHRRLMRRRREQPLDGVEGRLVEDDRISELADRNQLLRSLALLPPRQRAVLVLRYWDDLSYEEIASTMRCSVGTVKSQVSRGLARLRQLPGVSTGRSMDI